MNRAPLTIEKLTKKNDGVAPTYAELAAELGIYPGTAHQLALGLLKRGRIRSSRLPRSIELVKEKPSPAGDAA